MPSCECSSLSITCPLHVQGQAKDQSVEQFRRESTAVRRLKAQEARARSEYITLQVGGNAHPYSGSNASRAHDFLCLSQSLSLCQPVNLTLHYLHQKPWVGVPLEAFWMSYVALSTSTEDRDPTTGCLQVPFHGVCSLLPAFAHCCLPLFFAPRLVPRRRQTKQKGTASGRMRTLKQPEWMPSCMSDRGWQTSCNASGTGVFETLLRLQMKEWARQEVCYILLKGLAKVGCTFTYTFTYT